MKPIPTKSVEEAAENYATENARIYDTGEGDWGALESAVKHGADFTNDYHSKHTLPAYEAVIENNRQILECELGWLVKEPKPTNNQLDRISDISAALEQIKNLNK